MKSFKPFQQTGCQFEMLFMKLSSPEASDCTVVRLGSTCNAQATAKKDHGPTNSGCRSLAIKLKHAILTRKNGGTGRKVGFLLRADFALNRRSKERGQSRLPKLELTVTRVVEIQLERLSKLPFTELIEHRSSQEAGLAPAPVWLFVWIYFARASVSSSFFFRSSPQR